VNIGDIGHTPGALGLLERHFPEAEVTLWPSRLEHGSRELLTKAFPRLRIAEGGLDAGRKPSTPALAEAWQRAGLYLSGSGSGFPASDHAAAFQQSTGKPVGVFGVSTDPISGFGSGRDAEGGTLATLRARALRLPPTHLPPDLRLLMDRCAFFYCRDTISRDYLRAQGIRTPVLEFGPDAQLGMTLRDDARALPWLREHGLEQGRFLCVIPRLRYTPYYKIRNTPRRPEDEVRDAINDRTTEADHARLRDLISLYVRNTGHRVLVCAEMTYQIELGKQVLVDPLPEEIRRHVVWRDTYWLPDEAASIYARAQAVAGFECHSPLIAYHNGTPALYVRQPTDTCKGQMYADFGAAEWLGEVEQVSGRQLWEKVEAIHRSPAQAKARVRSIMSRVEQLQKRMVDSVRAACRV
jgi:hypothetical protein